ncbi:MULTISPECIES: hypothetical protein [unclassified Bradyrhizobium]|uniref:hypothetical protein n=1 Tax=unclassified Bradyrhizobium TaxID=2631580 RepID=UPI0027D74F89|nr:hypothetical protein TM233_24820 [Bradyrhizobium sp. TM233]GMP06517.1 hypothetical protein TM239_45500 [Bradyrhizobium sp. TM239]
MRIILIAAMSLACIGAVQAQNVTFKCNVNNYHLFEMRFQNSDPQWRWCQYRCEADQTNGLGRATVCSPGVAIPPVQDKGGEKHLLADAQTQLNDIGFSYRYECKSTREELAPNRDHYCPPTIIPPQKTPQPSPRGRSCWGTTETNVCHTDSRGKPRCMIRRERVRQDCGGKP